MTKLAWFGLIIVVIFFVLALFGEGIAPYSYSEQDYINTLQPPTLEHPFGTDHLGRDVFSRVLVGSRSIIFLATTIVGLSVLLAVIISLVVGYKGGVPGAFILRAIDAMLAFPELMLALLVISVFGTDTWVLIVSVMLIFVPRIALVIRSQVLNVTSQDYVEAARAIGATTWGIRLRHVLSNIVGVTVVEASIYFRHAIAVGAGLSFLGLGVQPPSPDWGLQINEGRNFFLVAPWIVIFPSLAISLLVIGATLFANGLAEFVNAPRKRRTKPLSSNLPTKQKHQENAASVPAQ